MRPTETRLCLTPKLARGISANLVRQELGPQVDMSEDQMTRLTDAYTKRMIEMTRDRGAAGAAATEYFYERIIEHLGEPKFNADSAREFAEHVAPGLEIIRDFTKGMLEDGRSVLTPDQYADYEENINEGAREFDRFAKKLERWRNGGYREGESFGPNEEDDDGTGETGEAAKKRRERAQKRSRSVRRANRALNEDGPAEWGRLLTRLEGYFNFSPEQQEAGRKLLESYKAKAAEIMTAEWTSKLRWNRMQAAQVGEWTDAMGAYGFHLDSEYDAAVKPLRDLGEAFRVEAMGLVSAEQREREAQGLRELAAKYGASDEELQPMLELLNEAFGAAPAPGGTSSEPAAE